MTIPDYQTFMSPLLRIAADQQEHALRDVTEELADHFRLSPDERNAFLPRAGKTILYDRVSWARTYMGKAGLLESTARGRFRITPRGLEALGVPTLNREYLMRFPEVLEFMHRSAGSVPTPVENTTTPRTGGGRRASVPTPEDTTAKSETPDELL